jgi:rubrerythrin
MVGGIRAWQGLKAEGFPEIALEYFASDSSTEELIVLAWLLEEGAREFYRAIIERTESQTIGSLFDELAKGEEKHKAILEDLHAEFVGKDADLKAHDLSQETDHALMEGGVSVNEALDWAQGKDERNILEFSIALEANAYDRYLAMKRSVEPKRSKEVFDKLAAAEKLHLESIAEAFERIT